MFCCDGYNMLSSYLTIIVFYLLYENFLSAPSRDRTDDLSFNRRMFYRLNYQGKMYRGYVPYTIYYGGLSLSSFPINIINCFLNLKDKINNLNIVYNAFSPIIFLISNYWNTFVSYSCSNNQELWENNVVRLL